MTVFRRSLLLACFAFLPACSSPKVPSRTLALVNGEAITLADFQESLKIEGWKFGAEPDFPREPGKDLKARILENMIRDRLLLQEAAKRGISVDTEEVEESLTAFRKHYPKKEDFDVFLQRRGFSTSKFRHLRFRELMIRKLTDRIVSENVPVTPEKLWAYYHEHIGEYRHGEQVLARQIVTDSREKGAALREMLDKGASFEDVAEKYSLSPDRKKGGILGWFGRGEMPKAFDEICFQLEAGVRSPVVKTPYGFHIFEVLEKREAGQFAFDDVKEDIRRRLVEGEARRVFREWYETLRRSAVVQIDIQKLGEMGG